MNPMFAIIWCFALGGACLLHGLFGDFARWGDSITAQRVERGIFIVVGGTVVAFGVIGLLYPNF